MRNRVTNADRGVNHFEATYQQLAIAWIDDEIARLTEQLADGSPLLKPDASAIAMSYGQFVYRIRAMQDVKAQLIEIERKLMGA